MSVCQDFTLGNPASSHSLIMPMKSVALAATNSALKAHMTEFSNKALCGDKDFSSDGFYGTWLGLHFLDQENGRTCSPASCISPSFPSAEPAQTTQRSTVRLHSDR